jgi:serine/threonine-protein kinase
MFEVDLPASKRLMELLKIRGKVGEGGSPSDVTIEATPAVRTATCSSPGEDHVAMQIGFRRALGAASWVWGAFIFIDFLVVHYLHAGVFSHFLIPRLVLLVTLAVVLRLMRRTPPLSKRGFAAADLISYSAAAVAMALMCIEFRGLVSPYISGFCLVLFTRTVASQEPWKRGLFMNGVPVVSFFACLLSSAAFSPIVAAQLHEPSAIAALLLGVAYVLGTYVFLVVNGHIVWALRRQVFEARNLGRYRLKRRIASGGMGDVWVGHHPGLKRDVAVKILRPEEQARSGSAQARFEREVRATAELAHPNTVRVFDYGVTEDGLWYYVMELLEGETLAAHVERIGPLPPARAVHIVGQAARAIAEAHERGIVHRDIKPDNLFLTSLGGEHDFVKVIDFGIAKVSRVDVTMTGSGLVMGTPEYMSPEVVKGEPADARSDVYALGEVLYFLLCGRPPFQRESVGAIMFAQVHEPARPPSRVLGRQLPGDVELVVMRALQKDPHSRYQTAAELAMALSQCALAGKWTFGDAALLAKQSSRPPPPGMVEALPSMLPPRVPRIESESDAPPAGTLSLRRVS